MIINVPFLPSAAIAGVAFLAATATLRRSPLFRRYFIPAPALAAWLLFPVFAHFAGRYYGAVISTVFLAITTGWGPLGMAYMRRFTDEEGPIPPMPVMLPLNSFYAIPWLMVGVSYGLLQALH